MSFKISLQNPHKTLITLFLCTRLVYYSIALLTPSPAYDSSTNLIFPAQNTHNDHNWSVFTKLAERLTRWDAIYFVKVAERGYIREQEWAFGFGMTRLMGYIGRIFSQSSPSTFPQPYASIFAGLLIANLSHLLSALILCNLTNLLYPIPSRRMAFVAAALHIFSPAGIFLAAPYSESLFSLLSFLGYYLYAKSTHAYKAGKGLENVGTLLGTGALWMLAGMVRSNGVLNGLVLLIDFLREGSVFLSGKNQSNHTGLLQRILRLLGLGLAGVMVGLGLVIPQAIAWREYCTVEGKGREWCTRTIPSIYFYVQDKYWNVGFLRYWTPGNIPLFFLAAPMLYILIRSACSILQDPLSVPLNRTKSASTISPQLDALNTTIIRTFALPQLLLAVLALTSYHVQIINRLSSGYVVWYWWLAQTVLYEMKEGKGGRVGKWAVRWCVTYALIQGVLFAAFLPPA